MPAEAINEALRLTTSQIYRNELEIDKKYIVLSGVLIEKKMDTHAENIFSLLL